MEIELPNGQIAEFPDEMPQDQIESVLQQHFKTNSNISNKPKQLTPGYSPKGFGGIGHDIAESVLSAPGSALKSLLNLPEHAKNASEYSKEEPWYHSAGQLGIGATEGLAGLLSAPQVGARYLSEKFGKPEGAIYKGLHETQTPYELMQEVEKQLKINPTKKGESEIRALGQLLGARKIASIPSKAGRVGTISAAVAGQGGDPVHAALASFLAENVPGMKEKIPEWLKDVRERAGLENKLGESEAELAERESALKTAQAESGGSSPEALKVKSEDLEKNINELNSKLKNEPKASEMLPDLRHEQNLENATNFLEQSQNNVVEANNAQSQQLGIGQNFAERAAPLVRQGVEDIKNSIRPLYDSVDEDLMQRNVVMPNNEHSEFINNEMNRLINSGILTSESDPLYDRYLQNLQQQFIDTGLTSSMSAVDFVQLYKSMRDMERIARNRSREGGIPADQRLRWETQVRSLTPLVNEQRTLLRESIPQETYQNLMNADRLWGQRVIPFYNNKVYRDVMHPSKGRTPENIIKSTNGTTESNRVMQQLIRSIPELNRLALGQIYANSPNDLFTYNEMTEPYINAHAPTQRLMEVQRRAQATHERAQNIHETANQRATNIRESQEHAAKEAQKVEKENNKIKNEIEKLTQKLNKNNENIKKLEEEIEKYGQSKERNEKLKAHKKQKEELKKHLWNVATSAGGYLFGQNIMKTIFKALFR